MPFIYFLPLIFLSSPFFSIGTHIPHFITQSSCKLRKIQKELRSLMPCIYDSEGFSSNDILISCFCCFVYVYYKGHLNPSLNTCPCCCWYYYCRCHFPSYCFPFPSTYLKYLPTFLSIGIISFSRGLLAHAWSLKLLMFQKRVFFVRNNYMNLMNMEFLIQIGVCVLHEVNEWKIYAIKMKFQI